MSASLIGRLRASAFRLSSIDAARGLDFDVNPSVAHATPFISLLAGFLILVAPALLNYIVAIYAAGLVGLDGGMRLGFRSARIRRPVSRLFRHQLRWPFSSD